MLADDFSKLWKIFFVCHECSSYLNWKFWRCEHCRSTDCFHCFSNLCRIYPDLFITYKLWFRKPLIRFIPVLRQSRIYPRKYEYFMCDDFDLANYQAIVVVKVYAFNEFYFCPKSYNIFLSQHLFDENILNETDLGCEYAGCLNRCFPRCNHKSRHCLLCFKPFSGFFKCLYTTMEGLAVRKENSKKQNFQTWLVEKRLSSGIFTSVERLLWWADFWADCIYYEGKM